MSMTAMANRGAGQAAGAGAAQQQPFLLGSNLYTEAPFDSFTVQLGAAPVNITPPWEVTPGNFLDGITLTLTVRVGVFGTSGAAVTNDGVLAVIPSINFENTNGGNILYPMGLQEYTYAQKYLRPWEGDPQTGPQYSNSINPAISARPVDRYPGHVGDPVQHRRQGDLPDAHPDRALSSLITGTPTTAPTVTLTGAIKSWAQPPAEDYLGRPIAPFPPGIGVQRKLMAQTSATLPSTGTYRFQLNLTGNEVRGFIFIFRNSSGARTNLTDSGAGSIQLTQDNQTIWTMLQSQWINKMLNFYAPFFGGRGGVNIETGVYAYPRFRGPWGGDPWMATVEQTNLYLTFGVSDVASGTVEVIWDQIAVGVPLPPSMESI